MAEVRAFAVGGLAGTMPVSSQYSKEELQEAHSRIQEDLESSRHLFDRKHEDARRNSRFVRGDQWDAEEKEAHRVQNRIPYVFDQISPKVNSLLGAQQQIRVESKAIPVEPNDKPAVDIQNRLLKWADQINDIRTVQDQVFYDMVVKGAAATCVRWSLSDFLDGYPIVERVPIYQMYWDPNSVDSSLKDAKWMARVIPMSKQDALEEFPEFADYIESSDGLSVNEISTYDAMTDRQRAYGAASDVSDNRRNILLVVEHYEKAREYTYVVSDGIRNETTDFDEEADAKAYLSGLMEEYVRLDENLLDDSGEDRVQIACLHKDVIIQTITIGAHAVRREVVDIPDFPYQVAFCYFDDGEYWSFVDLLIHPQKFLNRQVSELDNQIGRSNKHLTTIIPTLLVKGWDVTKVNNERSKTGATIPVMNHDAIKAHPNLPATPELQNTISFAISHMLDVVGGRNAMGLQENAAESGAAVRARQEAAGLTKLPIFSHLNTWRKKVSEMMMWYMKNLLSPGQQLRIIGSDDDVEWVTIDIESLDTVRNARTDIVVTEAVESDTLRERQFTQLRELFQTLGPALPPEVMLNMMLEYSSLPEGPKSKILDQLEFYKSYQQQVAQAQEQQKLEQSVERSLEREQLKEQKQVEAAQGLANS